MTCTHVHEGKSRAVNCQDRTGCANEGEDFVVACALSSLAANSFYFGGVGEERSE